jgi:hypothetical protein
LSNILTSSRTTIGGVLLALPFAIIFTLLLIGGEPPRFGPLEPLLTAEVDRPNVVGSAIVFGTWLLALIAFILNVDPIVRDARAGRSIATHPANLLVAVATFCFVALFVGGIIDDQYPCWIGVPNCD